ncbi:hypothetical protein [Persicobacter psychrovividus]|uniref:Uncharacterized protein n=1 Tax=Persicobacter psychrovividus TaxID=387638 RepID=A0ABN6L8Q1_9BACT|nr:hypothetical protein PEPS_17890 [Persicobacter psychrovividus]
MFVGVRIIDDLCGLNFTDMQITVNAKSWDELVEKSISALRPFAPCRTFKLTIDLKYDSAFFVDALQDYQFMEVVEHMFSGQTVMHWNAQAVTDFDKGFEFRFRFKAKGITAFHPKYRAQSTD